MRSGDGGGKTGAARRAVIAGLTQPLATLEHQKAGNANAGFSRAGAADRRLAAGEFSVAARAEATMSEGRTGPGPATAAAEKLTLLERREIEARIVGPLIRAVQDELGPERTLALVRRVVSELARESGAELARAFGEASLGAFARCVERWSEGGALEIAVRERSEDRLEFDVTRCRFAEMYRALGLADLGSSLSCRRDFALIEGFNPDVTLTRTQTIMEGASHCDFRFRKKEG